MTSRAQMPATDGDLLAVAEVVLSAQGYFVEKLDDPMDWLLAENAYFVVAVVASHTIQDLRIAQGPAEEALAERLTAASIGPKKWDAYLVLLTQEKSPEDDLTTRELYAINYDTTRLRRIAHTGVSVTSESVSHALAPFVAPLEGSASDIHEEPFSRLLAALEARGVDRDLADRAIAAFEQGASLDDVL
jgi:hypothetical protein